MPPTIGEFQLEKYASHTVFIVFTIVIQGSICRVCHATAFDENVIAKRADLASKSKVWLHLRISNFSISTETINNPQESSKPVKKSAIAFWQFKIAMENQHEINTMNKLLKLNIASITLHLVYRRVLYGTIQSFAYIP